MRHEHGLPKLAADLRTIYSDADHVLYADSPDLFPIDRLPSNHHYLGPILWSAKAPLPSWWNDVPDDRPSVYVTLGSSGRASTLSRVVDALADLPVTLLISTAGGPAPRRVPPNALVADYLPGTETAARSRLVVCNGGSLTCQQALTAGVPVIHFGTGCSAFFKELHAAGGDVIGVDWRINIDQAWMDISYRSAIQGNLDPAVLFAPLPELKARVHELLKRTGTRPGHIFNLGHGILPDTPVDHVKAVVDMVRNFKP